MQLEPTSASLRVDVGVVVGGAGDCDEGAVAVADADGPTELDAEAFCALSTDSAAEPEVYLKQKHPVPC